MLFNFMHLKKIFLLTLFTVDSIEICFKESQLENAFSPIIVTDEGMTIFFKFLHPHKASALIDVTDEEIIITSRLKFCKKC